MPIDEKLLIHTVTLTPYLSENNNDDYTDSETVENVRIEPHRKPYTESGLEVVYSSALMFVDVVHSKYSDIKVFAPGSVVEFDGVSYTIREVEKLYTTELHHLEVALV